MKNTLRTTGFNNRIIGFAMILGLLVISMSGCQQVNNVVNGNTTANTNTAMNSNANSNANSNVTANSNANTSVGPSNSAANTNTQASNTAANTATPAKEETPMTPEVKAFKVNLVGEWKTTDGTQVWRFDENKLESKFTEESNFQNPLSYRILDEKTIEFAGSDKATITFENNGNDLLWVNQGDGRKFKLTRVNPK